MTRLPAIAAYALYRVTSAFALLLAAALLFALMLPVSGAIGPDNYGYTAAATTFKFEELSVDTVPSLYILDATDDDEVTIPIGFPFTFYGVTYTSVSVSTNGLLTFGGSDTDYQPIDFRTTAPPANLKTIAVLWHDWTFQDFESDSAYYLTTGTPGSQRLIVQWNFAESPTSPSTDTVTFQVKLFEGSNNIEFDYDDATVSGDNSMSNGRGSTVGIRDINGQTNGRNLEWSYNQAVINNKSAILYIAPAFRVKTMTKQANGTMLLQCSGAPSKPNYLEATTNLVNGFTRLNPNTPVTAGVNGNFNFTDTSPGTRKFYRVGYP